MSTLPISAWILWAALFAIFGQAFEPWRKSNMNDFVSWFRVVMVVEFVLIVPCILWTLYLDYATYGTGHLVKVLLAFWLGGLVLSMLVLAVTAIPIARSTQQGEMRAEALAKSQRLLTYASLLFLIPSWFALKTFY